MTAAGTTVTRGGAPTAAEAAALGAAVAALLEGEAAAAAPADALPSAYRSRWRRAAALEALRPMAPGGRFRDGGRP